MPRRFGAALLAAILITGCSSAVSGSSAAGAAASAAPLATASAAPTPQAASVAAPTLARLIGQKLVVRMDGTTPSASLLGRIRRGEIGGLILFGSNVTSTVPADQADRNAPGGRQGGRSAASPDRDRPGRWVRQADPVGAADPVRAADGRARQHDRRPDAGCQHGRRAEGPRDQRRLRSGRRRAGNDGLVHVSRRAGPGRSARSTRPPCPTRSPRASSRRASSRR